MVAVMLLLGIAPSYAGFAPSAGIPLSSLDRSSDLLKIQKVLELKMVQERLLAFGFTPDEIQTRLHQLSDEQVHQLALKLDEMNVGGHWGSVFIVFLLAAIVAILVIYLLGYRLILKKG